MLRNIRWLVFTPIFEELLLVGNSNYRKGEWWWMIAGKNCSWWFSAFFFFLRIVLLKKDVFRYFRVKKEKSIGELALLATWKISKRQKVSGIWEKSYLSHFHRCSPHTPWYTVKTIYCIEILDCENISRESSRVTLFNQQKQPSN